MMRDIPCDLDSELVLLGTCILLDNPSPLHGLEPGLFYERRNQRLATEILAMAAMGEPITSTRISERLLNEVSPSYISALTDSVPIYRDCTSYDLSFYQKRVIQWAIYRRGAAVAYNLQQAYLGGNSDQIKEALLSLEEVRAREGSGPEWWEIHAISVREFLAKEIKPRAMLLDPIIPEQGLAMLYSRRGIGKTHVALGMAVAVASGSKFLRWTAPNQNRVLYIEGELPSSLLQKWIAETVMTIGADAVGEICVLLRPTFRHVESRTRPLSRGSQPSNRM